MLHQLFVLIQAEINILFKLLSNIIRFVQTGSAISIHASQTDNHCTIEFLNKSTPIGINTLNAYFNKLSTPNSHDAVTNQSGLGFAVAKNMVDEIGGELSYNSNETFGNYFKIKFKRA